MKPTNQQQPNLVGPSFTLDESGLTYQDLFPVVAPERIIN